MAPGRQKQRHFSPGHEGGWGAEKSARQDRGGPGFQVSPLNSSPGSRGPRGCHSLPFQPGEVGGQLSLLLVTGKQGLWGNRPELHLPPPPSSPHAPLLPPPPQPCLQARTPHFCLLTLPQPPTHGNWDTSTLLPAQRRVAWAPGREGPKM